MKLNQLNNDGLITWIQLMYGPCHSTATCNSGHYPCNGMDICINHTTCECLKTLIDNKIKIDLQYELRWATKHNQSQIAELLQQYITNDTK